MARRAIIKELFLITIPPHPNPLLSKERGCPLLKGDNKYNMNFLELAKSRRSVRQYRQEKIPREQIEKIIEAGHNFLRECCANVAQILRESIILGLTHLVIFKFFSGFLAKIR